MTEERPDPGSSEPGKEAVLTWPRLAGFVVSALALCLLLPLTEAEQPEAEALTSTIAARDLAGSLKKTTGTAARPVALVYEGPAHLEEPVLSELRQRLVTKGADAVTVTVKAELARDGEAVVLHATVPTAKPLETSRRIGGWEAILPPLLAVLIALFFRQLLIGLGAAIWTGAAIIAGFDPIEATWQTLSNYLGGNLTDAFNLYVIAFTFGLVGMVNIITRMGGNAGLISLVGRVAKSARSTRVATALMGFAVFFDDYANTVVVGTTVRPLADRFRISREKLAYLVDSTSAPIAGLAVISTWIGYEVGLFDELSRGLALGRSGYDIFFAILPTRFYCLLTLAFVLLSSGLDRDFGPMLKAERRAAGGKLLRDGARPMTSAAFSMVEPEKGAPPRWFNAVIPVAVVVLAVIGGLYWSGWSADGLSVPGLGQLITGETTNTTTALGAALNGLGDWGTWRDAFSNADNGKVLFWAAVIGSLTALALALGQGILDLRQASTAWLKAIPAMALAVAILILAWSIRSVCDDLGTSIYLVGATSGFLEPTLVPVLTFALAAIVAFSTGTSWGTMGILLPAMVPLAHQLAGPGSEGELIVLLTFGAVLDGAIFGDHCSPISDTTVMSSIACSCDHLDHVRTQIPYAMVCMVAAAGFGYVAVAYGFPAWAAILSGIASLTALLVVLGRSPTTKPA